MDPKNYRMDDATLERLRELSKRRAGMPECRKSDCSHTQLLREAVVLLYEYEVLGHSLINPRDPRFN